jgi:hypothetical protein
MRDLSPPAGINSTLDAGEIFAIVVVLRYELTEIAIPAFILNVGDCALILKFDMFF